MPKWIKYKLTKKDFAEKDLYQLHFEVHTHEQI